ncbi:MAG TPA: DHH family phosphoesterase [Methanoregulaceae archaeon]|nr:DHH family phosphoesterase [Methanoregulaceae archaeon]
MPEAVRNEALERVKYVVLGCGSTGYNIVQELCRESNRILVVDRDESRVRELRDQNFDALAGDIADISFMSGLPVFEIAFIFTSDHTTNLTAIKAIRTRLPGAHIVARAADPVSAGVLASAGADFVLYPPQVVARAAIHQVNKLYANRISQRLSSLLAGWEGTLGIITHKNPDPDAISSALALATIARSVNPQKLNCRIFYDGVIGHQENRTMVNLLEIRMEKMDPQVIQDCNYLALVDCPGPGQNNALSPRTRVHIIIDHHGNGPDLSTPFVDIRPGLGATASILSQYMQELDIPVDKFLATGLLYGIRSDTRDFRRNVTSQDLNNAAFLLPLTDSELLDQIMSPSLSQETLDVLGNAIRSRRIQSGYLISNVGYVRNRDSLPQAADLLISLEGVNTALVYGISDDAIVMSARNRDIRLHIGNVLDEAFGDIGDAGGHPNMAAATIPLIYFQRVKNKDELLFLIMEPLLEKFKKIVGLENEGKDEL